MGVLFQSPGAGNGKSFHLCSVFMALRRMEGLVDNLTSLICSSGRACLLVRFRRRLYLFSLVHVVSGSRLHSCSPQKHPRCDEILEHLQLVSLGGFF